ncbi:MAG: glutathione synthase [Myxococcota bacterium]
MQRTVAFVMDPLERIHPAADTSFALMLEAQARGFRVLHVAPKALSLAGSALTIEGHEVELQDTPTDYFKVLAPLRLAATDCAAIFIRTDPPFDEHYLMATWLLSFAEEAGVRVINSPRGIRGANEKLYALIFADVCPETIITTSRDEVKRFLKEHGGQAIAKPLDGHGGFGVMRLMAGDSNVNAIVDTLSVEGKKPILVQAYLPEGAVGDKRLFMIDGKLAAALQRVPPAGDHRGNVHVGGSVKAAEVGDAERKIAERLGPRLKADGIYFAGLDVIADKLIEVNVTSPTLTRELKRLGGADIPKLIFDSLR